MIKNIMDFYRNKRVLVTGHTGFKGSWMTTILLMAGAKVIGYALEPATDPNLFSLLGFDNLDPDSYPGELTNVYADVRDLNSLKEAFDKAQP